MKTIVTSLVSAILGAAISLTLVGQAQVNKTPSAVAYVSSNRIFTESVHGRSEGARLQSAQQQRTNELRAKQQSLETTRKDLATSPEGPSRSELQQKELQQRTDLERSTQQAQLELQNLQREVNGELQRRVRAILDDLMKTQSYQLVLNAEASVLWSAPELDLTAAVIARMNGQQPGGTTGERSSR